MIESGMRAYFLANPAVVAIIQQRIYPHEAPQYPNAKAAIPQPYVAYRLITDEEPRALDGKPRKAKLGYDIACCDSTFDGAKALSATVKAAIPDAGIQTTLDGTDVIMFWADQPERNDHVTAHDKIRYQVILELVILVK